MLIGDNYRAHGTEKLYQIPETNIKLLKIAPYCFEQNFIEFCFTACKVCFYNNKGKHDPWDEYGHGAIKQSIEVFFEQNFDKLL